MLFSCFASIEAGVTKLEGLKKSRMWNESEVCIQDRCIVRGKRWRVATKGKQAKGERGRAVFVEEMKDFRLAVVRSSASAASHNEAINHDKEAVIGREDSLGFIGILYLLRIFYWVVRTAPNVVVSTGTNRFRPILISFREPSSMCRI